MGLNKGHTNLCKKKAEAGKECCCPEHLDYICAFVDYKDVADEAEKIKLLLINHCKESKQAEKQLRAEWFVVRTCSLPSCSLDVP
jgi:hypothetical protein